MTALAAMNLCLSNHEAHLVRDALAFAVRNSFGSAGQRRALVAIAEHRILHELLHPKNRRAKRPMSPWRVSTWRQEMYETKSTFLPAPSLKAVLCLVRILCGPGNWTAKLVTST